MGNLRVSCRVRPLTSGETKAGQSSVVEVARDGEKVTVMHQGAGEKEESKRRFDFTHVYGPASTQEDVFRDTEVRRPAGSRTRAAASTHARARKPPHPHALGSRTHRSNSR